MLKIYEVTLKFHQLELSESDALESALDLLTNPAYSPNVIISEEINENHVLGRDDMLVDVQKTELQRLEI